MYIQKILHSRKNYTNLRQLSFVRTTICFPDGPPGYHDALIILHNKWCLKNNSSNKVDLKQV